MTPPRQRPRRLLAFLALTFVCTPASAQTSAGRFAEGRGGMVVSAHPAATVAGRDVLAEGGNAVDAAVAVGLALSVAEPQSSGIGGGGFLVLHVAAEGRQTTFDYRETAPAAATRNMFLRGGHADPDASRWTGDAVAVPGVVRGLAMVHERYGKLPFARLVAPALALAQDGVTVTAPTSAAITRALPHLGAKARAVFAPAGKPLPPGTTLYQPTLAQTLEAIMRDGPAGFYEGRVAATLEQEVQAAGGRLTRADLAAYRAKERAPVRGSFLGYEMVSMPPPSSGGVHLIQMLNILSRFPIRAQGPDDARTLHVAVEAMRHAYRDRALLLGDPDFVHVPVARLIDPDYAANQADSILLGRAHRSRAPWTSPETGHTTHFTVVDADGNAVAATHSVNLSFGSGILAAGVVLNNEMDDFAAAPGRPNAFGLVGGEANAVAPGKRPLSSMTPTLVLRDGQVVLTAGSPGGSTIITTTLQVILRVLAYASDVAEAVAHPRIHHQWLPDILFAEPGALDSEQADALRKLGHSIRSREPYGNAMAISVDPRTGLMRGAADPRGAGTAAAVSAP